MKIENEYDNIFRYVLYRVNCREEAEDITQETFLRYIQHSEYHKTGSERQVLYTIARNLCIDFYRKTKTEPIGEYVQSADNSDILRDVAVRVAMSKLSEEEREIIILRLVNGESISVIAKIFGISRFTMGRRINGIISKLKEELGKEELL